MSIIDHIVDMSAVVDDADDLEVYKRDCNATEERDWMWGSGSLLVNTYLQKTRMFSWLLKFRIFQFVILQFNK